eukprot:g34523.t1
MGWKSWCRPERGTDGRFPSLKNISDPDRMHAETNMAWRTINSVKDTFCSARNLLVFQNKELTLTRCCRLAHSKFQDYMHQSLQQLPRCNEERPLSEVLLLKYNGG